MGTVRRRFERRSQADAEAVEGRLRTILDEATRGRSGTLTKAMRYALFDKAKRLRPFLLVETAAMLGVRRSAALHAAAALECVHCYSLVHDDLPAMDDDDMRRGKPSLHKAFDEATAILAGDALLTLAFEVLAMRQTHQDAAVRTSLSLLLAKAAGANGMVGGQMLDLSRAELTKKRLLQMHALKTGALIRFAVEAGAILGGARPGERRLLRQYAEHLGAIYQLADDVADEVKDRETGRANAALIFGKSRLEQMIADHVRAATGLLNEFGDRGELLQEAVRYIAHV